MTIKELKERQRMEDQHTQQNTAATHPAIDQPTPETVTASSTTRSRKENTKRSASKSVHTQNNKVYTPTQESVYTTQEKPATPPEIIQQELQQDHPSKITQQPPQQDQDIISDNTPQSLPTGLHDEITAQIEYYCQTHNIDDIKKIHPLEWQAVCMQVGASIKSRGILRDREREKHTGGIYYDPKKMLAFLELYGYICGECKQVAFSHNFPRFAGVSREYFHDYMNKGLTSSGVGLAQKAHELQKASLVGAVTGGGSATVGNIFLSKALAGLQETVTVQHVSAAAAPVSNALPVFGGDNPALPVSENP